MESKASSASILDAGHPTGTPYDFVSVNNCSSFLFYMSIPFADQCDLRRSLIGDDISLDRNQQYHK